MDSKDKHPNHYFIILYIIKCRINVFTRIWSMQIFVICLIINIAYVYFKTFSVLHIFVCINDMNNIIVLILKWPGLKRCKWFLIAYHPSKHPNNYSLIQFMWSIFSTTHRSGLTVSNTFPRMAEVSREFIQGFKGGLFTEINDAFEFWITYK